ncbi:precorrin-6y C5,15-methyltransferase (decarboxylating) subunit CbiE [Salinisphaera sp. Q1T1-3]|uniref:precorrin-6y C5,15-methyltransferase (decarboxylating) subunit CbiE n=1 Tax=Salinisphaera sp. Q1T1-3 TaxID=2321229 RepID=UPI000E72B058|nr:precorrin-6y C5,15-methyltransferase (decarboxylating) subunit CbiE [Salinisphaera sp. Q1T1-3]RJS95112.1 precorrin-6y C5,15-methyltransferase (decarboxylating) subunit CbiE [Salinisphaera sp. Q1T1-3]
MSPERAGDVQPWLSLIGLGLDGWAGLGTAARQAIEQAELIVGGERHLAMLPADIGGQRLVWPRPFSAGIDAVVARRGAPVAVLATGDPFWFGAGATLARHIPATEMQSWPQPAAFQLAAQRLGWALQHVQCRSLHGRATETLLPSLAEGQRLLVLSWDASTPSSVAAILTEAGFGRSALVVLSNMGGADEQRHAGTARTWTDGPMADLNVLAIDCVADAPRATPDPRPARSAGRPDHLFETDGVLTKREVRATVFALLAPRPGERLWDVGAGSGAIAIEWLLADPDVQAVAIEQRADRVAAIRANAKALGVPHLECVVDSAPAAFKTQTAAPDAIFIGGGLTGPTLLSACRQRLAPGGRIVATSVTVEGDAVLARAHTTHGGTLRRMAVSRVEPLGRFAGWQPLRPVTIWSSCNDEDES